MGAHQKNIRKHISMKDKMRDRSEISILMNHCCSPTRKWPERRITVTVRTSISDPFTLTPLPICRCLGSSRQEDPADRFAVANCEGVEGRFTMEKMALLRSVCRSASACLRSSRSAASSHGGSFLVRHHHGVSRSLYGAYAAAPPCRVGAGNSSPRDCRCQSFVVDFAARAIFFFLLEKTAFCG